MVVQFFLNFLFSKTGQIKSDCCEAAITKNEIKKPQGTIKKPNQKIKTKKEL